MEAIHKEYKECRAHIGVVKEGKEVEQRKYAHIYGREEHFRFVIILKEKKSIIYF